MIALQQDQKIMVIGDFQTGKTTFCMWVLRQMKRYVVFDPTWAFPDGKRDIAGFLADFQARGNAVFQPTPDGIEAQFDSWCKAVMRLSNCLAYVDEPALVMGSRTSIPPGFSALYRLGHKRGIGVMLSTHRIQGDLPSLTKIQHHLFCFRATVPQDVDALEGIIGKEAAQYVRTQKDHHFYYRGLQHAQAYTPIPLNDAKPAPPPERKSFFHNDDTTTKPHDATPPK